MQLTGGLQQGFADQMGQLLGPDFPSDIGIAVSGGGDSMAMLHLCAGWAREFGVRVWCVTIDHGLREESAAEAQLVAQECAGLNVPHATLRWENWDGKGNVQDAARQARLELINRWRGGVQHVLFAHTQDDQAETFLMRLARGSGVDGLSGMRARHVVTPTTREVLPIDLAGAPPAPPTRADRWTIVRPLLGVKRSELRHYAETLKIPFVDDPSNQDDRFARVRAREFLAQEGLDATRLIATQKAMARAQEALGKRAHDAALGCLRATKMPGILCFERDTFVKIEAESQLRIMSAALQSATGATYRPRLSTLESALEKAVSGGSSTLHGAQIVPKGDAIYVGREFNAVKDTLLPTNSNELWDGRFLVYGPDIKGFYVRPLGPEGATLVREHHETEVPWGLLQGQPGIWDKKRLAAFQPLGFGVSYVCETRGIGKDFAQTLLTH